MDKLQSGIRITVRAVIIQNGNILLIKKDSLDEGVRYTLPGGALESGETLHQAVIRECEEEINTAVEAYDVLHIADFFIPKFKPEPYWQINLEGKKDKHDILAWHHKNKFWMIRLDIIIYP